MKIVGRILRNLNKDGFVRLLHFFSRKSFRFWEKYFLLHITPAHYYSPIPVTYELDSSVFEKIYDCNGIDWNLAEQLEYLHERFPKYHIEYTPSTNTGLSLVDAFVLYAMIREKKPELMIETGAGDTTKISLQALQMNKNEGNPCKFYSIEPYPRDDIKEIENKDFEVIQRKIQDVEVDLFSNADLVFIDSTHVSKIDSDVNYEILEIIPTLKVGSLVHWHDIVIPTNYWKEWIENGNQFWNESYMVHSFMLFNESFKTVWAARYMRLNYYNEMEQVFPYLQSNHQLMSFWIERNK
jgi:hypothetical protein